jgi:transcriptional regulator with XRE-family HTH domain
VLNNIKKYRLLSGISQKLLGESIGTSQQQIQRWENQTSKITYQKALEISKILKVNINQLIPNNKETKKNKNSKSIFVSQEDLIKDGYVSYPDSEILYELLITLDIPDEKNKSSNFVLNLFVNQNTHKRVIESFLNYTGEIDKQGFIEIEHLKGVFLINFSKILRIDYLFEPQLNQQPEIIKIKEQAKNKIYQRNNKIPEHEYEDVGFPYFSEVIVNFLFGKSTKWEKIELEHEEIDISDAEDPWFTQYSRIGEDISNYPPTDEEFHKPFLNIIDIDGEYTTLKISEIVVIEIQETNDKILTDFPNHNFFEYTESKSK